jgi:hypothetical protein
MRVLGITIMDEIPFPKQEPVTRIRQLPGTLLHEGSRGMGRDPNDMHPPCGHLHHYKHIVCHEAVPRGYFHREEVGRGEDLPVELQKLRPAHPTLSSLRRGIHMMATQNVAHRNLVDAMPQIRQSALDPSVTPTGVFLGHACDELFDLLGDARSTTLSSLLTPVKLLGHQSLVPAQERVRCGDGRHFLKALAPERVGKRREAAAFGVCQVQPATAEVGFEDAVFLDEVGDDLLLVTLEPASDHGDQDVEDHSRSSGWRHDEIVRSSIHPT